MAMVFDDLRRAALRRDAPGSVAALWAKEAIGMARFGLRERFGGRHTATPRGAPTLGPTGGPGLGFELRWAVRSVLSRGWRAALIVGLLAVTLAANALVFAVADSTLFRRVPYPDADRIVEILSRRQPGGRDTRFMSAALLDLWREQTDLFAGVEAYLGKGGVFVVGEDTAEQVPTADVTPGLIELLGVAPSWGRTFTDSDTDAAGAIPTLIGETMARRRFGRPESALGQRLATTGEPLLIVGVMPEDFRFPNGGVRLWRAMDPRGPLTYNFVGVMSIARMASGISMVALTEGMAARAPGIGEAGGLSASYEASPAPFYDAPSGRGEQTLLLLLLGAAFCLLLTACANVVNVELASALHRARTQAIQLALGASSATLRRSALMEGALLIGSALLSGLGLALIGLEALVKYLPPTLAHGTPNPIDLDGRAILFMGGVACLSWLISSLPLVLFAGRTRLFDLLKVEGHATTLSPRSTRVRGTLTVAEVALAVLLITGGLLFARSYRSLLAIDKGFDSGGVAQIRAAIPPHVSRGERAETARIMAERVRGVTGVVDATVGSAPPSFGTPMTNVQVAIDDEPPEAEGVRLAVLPVTPEYFSVLRVPLIEGRGFHADEPAGSVIVTEGLARRFWPDSGAAGRRFHAQDFSPEDGWEVVGVIRSPLHAGEGTPYSRRQHLKVFTPRQPPPPTEPATDERLRRAATGGSYGLLQVIVRLDSRSRAEAVLQAARSIDPRFRVTLTFVDDNYAETFDDTLLATRVMIAFGGTAFLVAIVGVYGLMAFLVSSRRREIGIRLAIGAGAPDISRLVLGSSLRLVAIGAVGGAAAAMAAARWIEARLFGVSPTDPTTYAVVAVIVVVTAIAATWRPARQAARVDPVSSLRTD